MQEQAFSVGLLVPGQIDESTCAALDAFLREHQSVGWVGAFDSELLRTARCGDLIVDDLLDHHTLPVRLDQIASPLGHEQGQFELRQNQRASSS